MIRLALIVAGLALCGVGLTSTSGSAQYLWLPGFLCIMAAWWLWARDVFDPPISESNEDPR